MTNLEKAETELNTIVQESARPAKEKAAFQLLVNAHICDWVGYGYPKRAADEWARASTKYPKICAAAGEAVARVMKNFRIRKNNV
jgi:hypothetical protein